MYEKIDQYILKLLNSTPNKPLWNIEAIRLNRKPSWNYIDGCMLSSLIELYKVTNNKKYIDFVCDFVDYFIDDNGNILGYDPLKYSTDDVCESKVLFDLYDYNHNEKYIKAIKLSYSQLLNHPRTKEGNFIHKAIYHDQVWLDGLYMVQPFYTRYLTMFDNSNYSDVVKQFNNVRNIMYDSNARLYYHGYDSSKSLFWANKETGLSKNFWLRSMGWFIVSLIDVYGFMNENNKEDKANIAKIFKEAIDGILLYKDKESNMFYQVINKPNEKGNYLETSGSFMIAYAILKGVRLNVLDKSYKQIGIDIFNGIVNRNLTIQDNGDINLKGICLVAGLGPEDNLRRDGSYEYYISEPIVENDAKGVGPFIMAYTEIKKL